MSSPDEQDLWQAGHEALRAYVRAIKRVIEDGESFDAIVAAGDSGQLAARITEEVYRLLGRPVPPKLVAPIYRHADEAETILLDNTTLAAQFAAWKEQPLANLLFVDDEIGEGNAIRGMLDLLLVLNPGIDSIIIVAEDGGFAGPAEIRGIKAAFIASRKRPANIYNAMSYTVPQEFREPLMWALKSEPDLNNKHLMCTLLGLPTKEFNDGKPAFNDRLIEQARRAIPNLAELQQGYQAHFIKTIADSLR